MAFGYDDWIKDEVRKIKVMLWMFLFIALGFQGGWRMKRDIYQDEMVKYGYGEMYTDKDGNEEFRMIPKDLLGSKNGVE